MIPGRHQGSSPLADRILTAPPPPPPSLKHVFFTSGTREGYTGCHHPYFKGAECNGGAGFSPIDNHTSLWGPEGVQIDRFSLDQRAHHILVAKIGFLHFKLSLDK